MQLRAQNAGCHIACIAQKENLSDAVRLFKPDVVVDMARPDRDSLDSVRALHNEAPAPVVMFIDDDDQAFMQEAIEAGVTSYYVRSAYLRRSSQFSAWRSPRFDART